MLALCRPSCPEQALGELPEQDRAWLCDLAVDYLVCNHRAEGLCGGTGLASIAGMDVVTTKDSYIPLFSGQPSDQKEWRKRLTRDC